MSVEPYTDPCVKCGSTDHWTTYHTDEWSCRYLSHNKQRGEHLHHGCRGCQWDWTEDTHEARLTPAAGACDPTGGRDG
jgi:hypothetical protein